MGIFKQTKIKKILKRNLMHTSCFDNYQHFPILFYQNPSTFTIYFFIYVFICVFVLFACLLPCFFLVHFKAILDLSLHSRILQYLLSRDSIFKKTTYNTVVTSKKMNHNFSASSNSRSYSHFLNCLKKFQLLFQKKNLNKVLNLVGMSLLVSFPSKISFP